MQTFGPEMKTARRPREKSSRWPVWVVVACLGTLLLAILIPRQVFTRATAKRAQLSSVRREALIAPAPLAHANSAPTAEQVVATKVQLFAQDRLRIARAMAKRLKFELPDEVEPFFKAAAEGRWEDLNDLFQKLRSRRDSGQEDQLRHVWGPILETLLIAECAHAWPAQKLLDYGQATLGSLPPGTVYVGGTDPGRGIPTLLNETSGADRHIILTQNGLADGTYLEYLRFLYPDQLSLPTEKETQQAFSSYIDDARKRLEHDRQFPDEPKQVQAGEDIRFTDSNSPDNLGVTNRSVEVSGNVAVMSINERILQAIMDKNPSLSFALEESFPLRSTYDSAVPLGPLMQLRAPDAQSSFTLDTAAQSLDYWRNTAEQLSSDVDAPEGSDVRKTYSHMASSQANLLAAHNYYEEAEQTYRLAMEMEPSNPEAAYSLAGLLAKTGRLDEARQVVDTFTRTHPEQTPLPTPSILVPAPVGN
jgi:tetratricopeptide (TPR) repeat protein